MMENHQNPEILSVLIPLMDLLLLLWRLLELTVNISPEFKKYLPKGLAEVKIMLNVREQITKEKNKQVRTSNKQVFTESHLIGDWKKHRFLKSTRPWMFQMNTFFRVPTVSVCPFTINQIISKYCSEIPPTKQEAMANELLRLCTFRTFPTFTGQSCIRLAEAGFYYEGNGDEVTCYICSTQIREWNSTDVPIDRHIQSSPLCPFVVGATTGSVTSLASGRSSPGGNELDNYHLDSGTVITSQHSNSNQLFGNRHICQHSNESQQSRSTSASTSNTNSVTTTHTQTSSRDSVSILYMQMRFPGYADNRKRLESFNGWQINGKDAMADSGFFYIRTRDSECVRCFWCGFSNHPSTFEDSPYLLHAIKSPKCPHINAVCGQGYVKCATHIFVECSPIGVQAAQHDGTNSIWTIRQSSPIIRTATGWTSATVSCAGPNAESSSGMIGNGQDLSDTAEGGQQTVIDSDELMRQNREMREMIICKICLVEEVSIAFLPCGHIVVCSRCASWVKVCSVCKKSVNGIVNVFL